MKETQVKKLLNGKDVNSDEAIVEITSAINDEYNHNLKKVETDHEKEVAELKDEILSLKGKVKASAELENQLKDEKSKNESMSRVNYIIKNINPNLSDEDVSDLVLFAKAKMKPDSKFEDVVKEVASKRGFTKKADEKPAEEKPTVSKPTAGVAYRQSTTYGEEDGTRQRPANWQKKYSEQDAKDFMAWRMDKK